MFEMHLEIMEHSGDQQTT